MNPRSSLARCRWSGALAAGLLLALVGCSSEKEDGLPIPGNGPGIPYTVKFEGPIGEQLQPLLDKASDAKRGEDRPPQDQLVLRQRAIKDVDNLTRAMQSLGYYDGTVTWKLEPAKANGAGPSATASTPAAQTDATGKAAPPSTTPQPQPQPQPQRLIFTLDPGQRYKLGTIEIVAVGDVGDDAPLPSPETLGLKSGTPVDAQRIIDAEQKMVVIVKAQGRPFAKAGPRQATIDRAAGTMALTLAAEPGLIADYGDITFTGINGIDEKFLRARLTVHEGDQFAPGALEDSRRELIATQLFSTIRIRTPDHLDATGRLPVVFEATQRPPRSVAASASYQTDEGIGVSASWEHRNFFGAGERVSVSGLLSTQRYSLGATYRKPNFLSPKQSLLLGTELLHEDVDAYTSDSFRVSAGIERELADRLTGTLGISYRLLSIDQNNQTQTYGLLSFPAGLNWDTTNDLLDPTSGGRLSINAGPYLDTLGTGDPFIKAQATYSHYFSLTDTRKFVLALRGSVGTITANSIDGIPPDERFYAGGGGSVRGIGYELAGPLDAKNDPIGGLSLLTINSELRWRINDTFGLVSFVDAGSSFSDSVPLSGGDLRVGAGVGLRYYTPIGPVRLDVAVPVNPRSGIDDAYQVYVSIGQAF